MTTNINKHGIPILGEVKQYSLVVIHAETIICEFSSFDRMDQLQTAPPFAVNLASKSTFPLIRFLKARRNEELKLIYTIILSVVSVR